MNQKFAIPWPHSPGVIARVEEYMEVGNPGSAYTHHTAVIYGRTFYGTYEQCAAWCEQQKRIAAWYEEQLSARPPAFARVNYSIADEMGV